MKAIILAAGSGTRLKPLTDDKPKCMVEYKGKPILQYISETLKEANIEKTVVVTGYRADKIPVFFTKQYHNEKYASTNMVSSLFCALEEFDDDLIISYSDIIYKPSVLNALIKSKEDFSVIIDKDWRSQWEQRMENPLEDAETLKLKDGKIIEIGKKPTSYDDIEGQYIGLIKISKNCIKQVIEFYNKLDRNKLYDGKDFNNMYMTSFIQLIIDRLMPVYPVFINGGWIEIDGPEDLKVEMT
jgi:choline kinase